jgi:23S rRNA pseudouridine2604 synthase
MCEVLAYKVVSLKRIRIMNIYLKELPVGKWRALSYLEVEALTAMLSNSVKTEEASRPRNKKK